jgi:transposase
MQFTELTDKQWNIIESHLPPPAKTGRPRYDARNIINGIIYVLITGCRWNEMPRQYGSKSTAHLRFQNLQEQGIWKKILSSLIKSAHKQHKINLQKISVDSSTISAKKRET